MTRVFITVDETNPLKPVAVLHINGIEIQMSEREFLNLINDAHWAKSHLEAARGAYFCSLATKYKEASCAV